MPDAATITASAPTCTVCGATMSADFSANAWRCPNLRPWHLASATAGTHGHGGYLSFASAGKRIAASVALGAVTSAA